MQGSPSFQNWKTVHDNPGNWKPVLPRLLPLLRKTAHIGADWASRSTFKWQWRQRLGAWYKCVWLEGVAYNTTNHSYRTAQRMQQELLLAKIPPCKYSSRSQSRARCSVYAEWTRGDPEVKSPVTHRPIRAKFSHDEVAR